MRQDTAKLHLLTCVGSTSPWMMFRMEMYLLWLKSLLRACVETMMFLVCSNLRITSNTVVLRTLSDRKAIVKQGGLDVNE